MKLKALVAGAAIAALALSADAAAAPPGQTTGAMPAPTRPATAGRLRQSRSAPSPSSPTRRSTPPTPASSEELKAADDYVEGRSLTIDSQNPQADQEPADQHRRHLRVVRLRRLLRHRDAVGASACRRHHRSPHRVLHLVTDPVAAELVSSWDAPDGNVTGASDLSPMKEQLELIREAQARPSASSTPRAPVELQVQVAEAEKYATDLGFEIKTATITNTNEVQQAAESLNVDAYLIPTDNAVVSAAESVIQVAEDKGTPVFASDESTMERGAAAGLSGQLHAAGPRCRQDPGEDAGWHQGQRDPGRDPEGVRPVRQRGGRHRAGVHPAGVHRLARDQEVLRRKLRSIIAISSASSPSCRWACT